MGSGFLGETLTIIAPSGPRLCSVLPVGLHENKQLYLTPAISDSAATIT